jgi:FkbM family methyltransferase
MHLKNVLHHSRIVRKIILTPSPFRRSGLLVAYARMLGQSFIISRQKNRPTRETFHASFLGLQVHFKSYPELIQLFEEIFIRHVYDTRLKTPLIIDCGSNIGISVLYFKRIYPEVRIIAFEPEADNFALLRQNVEANCLQDVTIHNVALAGEPGEQFLANSGGTSLNWQLADSAKGRVRVITQRLSTYIDRSVGLLKIDVEGAEELIIDDLIQTRKIDWIESVVLEYHKSQHSQSVEGFISKLEMTGFKCHTDLPGTIPEANEFMIWAQRKNQDRNDRPGRALFG